MKLFYFIITPFNYLNALEYRLGFTNDTDYEHHLILLTDHEIRRNQVEQCMDNTLWSSYIVLFKNKLNRKNYFSFYFEQINRKNILKNYITEISGKDQIVLGNFAHSYCRYIHNLLPNNNIIYIDDGFNSLSFPERLAGKPSVKKSGQSIINALVFNQYYYRSTTINMFSIFDFSNIQKINFIPNNFDALISKYISNKQSINEVYFIGQPLTELGYITKEKFDETILLIQKFYENQNKKFIYILHPGERQNMKPNFLNIIRLNLPIEFYFIENNLLPKAFATFFSTAIYSLSILFKNDSYFNMWWLEDFNAIKIAKNIFSSMEQNSKRIELKSKKDLN